MSFTQERANYSSWYRSMHAYPEEMRHVFVCCYFVFVWFFVCPFAAINGCRMDAYSILAGPNYFFFSFFFLLAITFWLYCVTPVSPFIRRRGTWNAPRPVNRVKISKVATDIAQQSWENIQKFVWCFQVCAPPNKRLGNLQTVRSFTLLSFQLINFRLSNFINLKALFLEELTGFP